MRGDDVGISGDGDGDDDGDDCAGSVSTRTGRQHEAAFKGEHSM